MYQISSASLEFYKRHYKKNILVSFLYTVYILQCLLMDVFFIRKEEDSRHRSKHKKTKKVKEEPIDEDDLSLIHI